MTLEEAIIHAEEVADRCAVTDGNIKCEMEHRQLAEWLRELKERREQDVTDTNVGSMISRQWVIDELKRYFHDEYYQRTSVQDCINCFIEDILTKLPSAQPEPSEITDEQAILHLQSTGWMQNHDREMYESGLREQLADDSGCYDSLITCEDTISRTAAIDVAFNVFPDDEYFREQFVKGIEALPSAQPKTMCVAKITLSDDQIQEAVEKVKNEAVQVLSFAQSEWNNHTVACLLAELFDDTCACNYNGIDEWLPEKCEVIDACPNPVGVACWEQYLKHRAERRTDD